MSVMPKPYPPEFRRDVVAVARKGQAPLTQIAKDFGISEGCLHNWMKKADEEDPARRRIALRVDPGQQLDPDRQPRSRHSRSAT